MIDLTGQRFGRLVVDRRGEKSRDSYRWACHCDCGNSFQAHGASLRRGNTRSCGCLQTEARSAVGKSWLGKARSHGATTNKRRTPEYACWLSMRQRCEDPAHDNYQDYGGRGIAVCARWSDFAAFLEDLGPRPSAAHSIERRDTNGAYEPENCSWATCVAQQANRRNSVRVLVGGVALTIKEAAVALGKSERTVYRRFAVKVYG